MKDFTFLDFDSGLFGYRVARIGTRDLSSEALDKILADLKKEGARLAYLFLDPGSESNQVAMKSGGVKVDSKALFVHEMREIAGPEESGRIASYPENAPCTPLYPLAYQSGAYSRFRHDPNFKHGEFQKLYDVWLERSVKREIADEVLTYNENDSPVGLVTFSLGKNEGTIGLFAVDQESRGKSVGRNLMLTALTALRQSGATSVSVATQADNVTACRFYRKQNFILRSIQNVYHFWL